jgi:hydroxymethylpyrimidine pyrophosphatase-like HAD family hydrolase
LALGEAFKIIGVSAEEVIATGDSATDIPMFALCGYPIALGNAPDELIKG